MSGDRPTLDLPPTLPSVKGRTINFEVGVTTLGGRVISIPAATTYDKRGHDSAVSLQSIVVGTKALAVSSVYIIPIKIPIDMKHRATKGSESKRQQLKLKVALPKATS